MTLEEIESLKKSGLHATVRRAFGPGKSPIFNVGSLQEIIKKQIEQHATYSLKTEYSKEKYRKRKEMKCVFYMLSGGGHVLNDVSA